MMMLVNTVRLGALTGPCAQLGRHWAWFRAGTVQLINPKSCQCVLRRCRAQGYVHATVYSLRRLELLLTSAGLGLTCTN